MYNCTFVPLALCFTYLPSQQHSIADLSIDSLFVADMVISCSTVFYNEHYEMIIDRMEILHNYLSTWFIVDLISVIPFDQLAPYIAQNDDDVAFVSAVLRLPVMLRLARFRKRVDRLSGANLGRLVWLFVLFVFIAHLVACTWWAIGRVGLQGWDDEHSSSWISRMELRHSNLGTQLLPEGELNLLAQQYFTALYWSCTALLKTPSIGPDTVLEKVFTIAVTIFGVLIFTVFIGNMIEVLQHVSHSDASRRQQQQMLSTFATKAKLSRRIRRQIFSHSEAMAKQTSGIDTVGLLHQFPRSLRGQIVTFMHRKTLRSSELLRRLSSECCKALLMCMTTQVCLQGEVLLGQGELCEYLYILQRGQLQIRDAPADDWDVNMHTEGGDAGIEIRKAISTAVTNVGQKVRRLSVNAATMLAGNSANPLAAMADLSQSGHGPSRRPTNGPSRRPTTTREDLDASLHEKSSLPEKSMKAPKAPIAALARPFPKHWRDATRMAQRRGSAY